MRFVGTALIAGTIGAFFLLADAGWMRDGTGTEESTKRETAAIRTNAKLVEPDRFRQFVGITVENIDGEKIGRIKDLVLQRRSGRPRYVIVRAHGFMGHQRLVPVPVFAIAIRTAKARIASVDVSTQQWKKAPEFKLQDLALLQEPGRAESIARFYGGGSDSLHAARDSEIRLRLSLTGRETSEPVSQKENVELELASDVVGKDVVDRQQGELGHVADLLVDFSEKKPVLALVSVTRPPGIIDCFVVPTRLLGPTQIGTQRIDADRESFERAQPFGFEKWEALERGQNEIYRWERR